MVRQCQDNIFSIQTLKDFQYLDKDGKDQGVNGESCTWFHSYWVVGVNVCMYTALQKKVATMKMAANIDQHESGVTEIAGLLVVHYTCICVLTTITCMYLCTHPAQ